MSYAAHFRLAKYSMIINLLCPTITIAFLISAGVRCNSLAQSAMSYACWRAIGGGTSRPPVLRFLPAMHRTLTVARRGSSCWPGVHSRAGIIWLAYSVRLLGRARSTDGSLQNTSVEIACSLLQCYVANECGASR